MPFENLIFQPFEIACPECICYMQVSFEDLQFNEPVTCTRCGNVFLPNKDMEAALRLIRAVEEESLRQSQEEEKKQR